jgi:hypothetical protein
MDLHKSVLAERKSLQGSRTALARIVAGRPDHLTARQKTASETNAENEPASALHPAKSEIRLRVEKQPKRKFHFGLSGQPIIYTALVPRATDPDRGGVREPAWAAALRGARVVDSMGARWGFSCGFSGCRSARCYR